MCGMQNTLHAMSTWYCTIACIWLASNKHLSIKLQVGSHGNYVRVKCLQAFSPEWSLFCKILSDTSFKHIIWRPCMLVLIVNLKYLCIAVESCTFTDLLLSFGTIWVLNDSCELASWYLTRVSASDDLNLGPVGCSSSRGLSPTTFLNRGGSSPPGSYAPVDLASASDLGSCVWLVTYPSFYSRSLTQVTIENNYLKRYLDKCTHSSTH